MDAETCFQNKINIKNYKICEQMNKNNFLIAYKARDIVSGNYYCAKVYDFGGNKEKCNKIIDYIITIMSNIKHPSIIKIIGYSRIDFQSNSNATIITELAKNRSLYDVINEIKKGSKPKYYSNTSKQIILIGISNAMKYLHDHNIIHSNLKSSNILLNDEFYPLITDIGMLNIYKSFNIDQSQLYNFNEIIRKSPESPIDSVIDQKYDVYSFGILIYEILSDSFMNDRMTHQEMMLKIKEAKFNQAFKEMIEECLNPNATKRPTFNDIYNKLSNIDNNESKQFLLPNVDYRKIKQYIEIIEKQKQIVELGNQTSSESFKSISNQDSFDNSTLLKIAFLSDMKLSSKFISKYKTLCDKYNRKLKTTIGKSILGNFYNEPKIPVSIIDDDDEEDENEKPIMINFLQNTNDLNAINIEDIKQEIKNNNDEILKKNWAFIFEHEKIFSEFENQLREDIENNGIEMIIIGQTIFSNKYFDEYEKIMKKIPIEKRKQKFLYHGTRLRNHQKILRKHFYMPGVDQKIKMIDEGYFGQGISATDNLFYALKYSNGYNELEFNKKTHVLCCITIYNDSKLNKVIDMSYKGKNLDNDVINNYGINYAISGSSCHFHLIEESEIDKNYIAAGEFVFGNKYQIIPFCSLTVMRADHLIIWKEEKIEEKPYSIYLNSLYEQTMNNIYIAKTNIECQEIVLRKKRNRMKIIIDYYSLNDTLNLIYEIRKIINSNIICLIYLNENMNQNYESLLNTENIIFTTSIDDVKKFISIEFDLTHIHHFISEIEAKYKYKFKLNEDQLLNFLQFEDMDS